MSTDQRKVMAMQIVIELAEQYYSALQKFPESMCNITMLAVKNGTVLPENHGDLIDRDKLEPDCYELEIHDGDDWRNEYCGVSLMQIEHYADVIIPATKENNE